MKKFTFLFIAISLALAGCIYNTPSNQEGGVQQTSQQEQPPSSQPVPSPSPTQIEQQPPTQPPVVEAAPTEPTEQTLPVEQGGRPGFLQNIGVNIADYNRTTNKAGDFEFIDTIDHYQHKIFLEFGIELCGGNQCGSLPSYNYFLPLGTTIFSPVKGTVQRVQNQGEDYEVVITPDCCSAWSLSFDHVVNLQVKEGDKIKPGDPIANPGPRGSVDARLGFVELQVWTGTAKPQAICPYLVLNSSVKDSMGQKITKLTADWETYLARDVHDESKWVAPGCLFEERDG